jgi:hypothetical protein
MSRSNPTLDNQPHPCQRWFEWDGDQGVLKYYDKEKKESVRLPKPDFTFIVLDQTCSIRGYNDKKKISFRSNEIRDTGKDILTVKSSDSMLVAQGIYSQIRERLIAAGARFNSNIYMAFKNGQDALSLGCVQLKGGSLNSWVEFKKKAGREIYTKAVKITGFSEHRTGKIEYRLPVFTTVEVSEATDNQAKEIDAFLQDYLKSYFARGTTQQVEKPEPPPPHESDEPPMTEPDGYNADDPENDVPF